MTDAQISKVKSEYNKGLDIYEEVLEEVLFILHKQLNESGIKIESIEDRVKEIDSVIDKCNRKI